MKFEKHTLTVELWAENEAGLSRLLYQWVLEQIALKIKNGETSGDIRGCHWELKEKE